MKIEYLMSLELFYSLANSFYFIYLFIFMSIESNLVNLPLELTQITEN